MTRAAGCVCSHKVLSQEELLCMLTQSVMTRAAGCVCSHKVLSQEELLCMLTQSVMTRAAGSVCSPSVVTRKTGFYAHKRFHHKENRLVCTQRVSPQGKKATYLTNSVITRRTDCMLIKSVVHLHKVSSQGDLVHTNYHRNDSRICTLTGDFEDREILSANQGGPDNGREKEEKKRRKSSCICK